MNTWGTNIRVSIFGESHGAGIGIVIDGLPGGIRIDLDETVRECERRSPGRNKYSTSRREADKVEILSGVVESVTTGTPIAGIIRNTNTISKHYQKNLPRPGHADYTGFMKYGESHDYRGGGHFSGRITAPLVFAGAIAKQVLRSNGIYVGAHIRAIGGIEDEPFDPVNIDKETLVKLGTTDFPVIDEHKGELMKAKILEAKDRGDSVGGVVEFAAVGMPAGKGSPFFGSAESRLSSMMFSIPAVKAVEFGAGRAFADMLGSEANDEFRTDGKKIYTTTNNSAGINGGITNGMPIIMRTVIRPTPSIAKKQNTVDLSTMQNAEIEINGRHDPCIVQRAAVVVENAAALALLDIYSED